MGTQENTFSTVYVPSSSGQGTALALLRQKRTRWDTFHYRLKRLLFKRGCLQKWLAGTTRGSGTKNERVVKAKFFSCTQESGQKGWGLKYNDSIKMQKGFFLAGICFSFPGFSVYVLQHLNLAAEASKAQRYLIQYSNQVPLRNASKPFDWRKKQKHLPSGGLLSYRNLHHKRQHSSAICKS